MKILRQLFLAVAVLLTYTTIALAQGPSLPNANITGDAATSATSLTFVNATISQVSYQDGTSTTANTASESIIGMTVTLSGATRTGNYTFADAIITISDGTFNYFSATLSNITLINEPGTPNWHLNPGLDASDISTLNLSSIVLSTDATHPSRFINELSGQLGSADLLGMKMILALQSGMIEGGSSSNISSGLLDGAPIGGGVEPPNGARTIGYWKNHDEERLAFDDDAVALSSVFSDVGDGGDLYLALTKKGKKTMAQKGEQQLAALLLNCASALDPATVLDAGELEILQLLNPAYDVGATVDDAKFEIENAILTSTDNDVLENAKDLADEINNRDHGN